MRISPLLPAAAIILCGCAVRQRPAGNWQLRPAGRGTILVPPQAGEDGTVRLAKARTPHHVSPNCNVDTPQIQLTWKGRDARLQVDADITAPTQSVRVLGRGQALEGEAVRDVSWWPHFRERLGELEKNGCVAPGEAERLAHRVVENLALSSSVAYQLRYGSYMSTGYFDLEPHMALMAVAPLLKPGVERYKSLADVRGYETAYYDLRARRKGLRAELRSVEHNIGGKISAEKKSSTQPIVLPEAASSIRYFFRVWKTVGDRKIALLAVARPESLDALTHRFEGDPEAFCRTASPAEASCLTIPSEMMLTPGMQVRTNGKTAYSAIDGTLRNVLTAAGVREPEQVVQRLVVLRPYAGALVPVDFDRTRGDILGLILIGGEEIRW